MKNSIIEMVLREAGLKKSGEDWVYSDAVKKIVPKVVQRIKAEGGSVERVSGPKIRAVVAADREHKIPLIIDIFEGSYDEGTALVNAYFEKNGQEFPVPTGEDRLPFDAKEILDAVKEGFMHLTRGVMYRGKGKQ